MEVHQLVLGTFFHEPSLSLLFSICSKILDIIHISLQCGIGSIPDKMKETKLRDKAFRVLLAWRTTARFPRQRPKGPSKRTMSTPRRIKPRWGSDKPRAPLLPSGYILSSFALIWPLALIWLSCGPHLALNLALRLPWNLAQGRPQLQARASIADMAIHLGPYAVLGACSAPLNRTKRRIP